jgi:hypothetical protein
VDVEIGRNRHFDGAQEAEKLLMSMSRFALREHWAGQHVQSREQCCRPVSLVVMGHAFDIAKTQRSSGWVRSNACTWLFSSTHSTNALSGGFRIRVEPDHIAQLLDEERIGRQLETFAAMRRYPKQLQISMHTGLRDTGSAATPRIVQCVEPSRGC